jgi:tripeptide aminopeptidase
MSRAIFLALCAAALANGGMATENLDAQVRALMGDPQVQRALEHVDRERERILMEWIEIAEINAPSGKERQRAEAIKRMLSSYELDQVYYDSRGNLVAIRKGSGRQKAVVFDAHLDTVFQDGLKIKAQLRDGKIFAPGIGDDTRNIVAMLAAMRALAAARIRTKADLIFLFTVEEETTMAGAEHFIKENRDRIGQYVALDGGYDGITYGGIGISWYKYHFIGPGGHTRSKTPPYSATLPLARAISRIYELPLPKDPVVNLNIGMLGGADVVNAKAADAWFTLDLRSVDQALLDEYEQKIARIVKDEAERYGMQSRAEVISKLPAAQLPGNRESFTVRMGEAVHRALGFKNFRLSPEGSNNSSVALLAGIPAISTGAALCGDAHALTEWCLVESIYPGIKKVTLLAIALAGLDQTQSAQRARGH